MPRLLWAAACLALLIWGVLSAESSAADPGGLVGPLSPGAASAATGRELLEALQEGIGDITLRNDIVLTAADWDLFERPIVIPDNATVLIHADDQSLGWNLRPVLLDWGGAIDLISVEAGGTLALSGITSQDPGNYTEGMQTMPFKVRGTFLWPTIVGEPDHTLVVANSFLYRDDPRCSPESTEAAIIRLQATLGNNSAIYLGGTRSFYPLLSSPVPITNISAAEEPLGTAAFTLVNVTADCFNSLLPNDNTGGGGGSGTPAWVWPLVGTAGGLLLILLAVGAAYWWRRNMRRPPEPAIPQPTVEDGSLHKRSSGASGPTGTELQSTFMRTRFGVIDDLELGELLGRGAYGRVYRGRWKGAIVAVKVIEHRVQPGKTHDLSREPLLSMSVSHPNVVVTHKICVVRILNSSSGKLAQHGAPADSSKEISGGCGSGGGGGGGGGSGSSDQFGSGGKLVPALGGGSGMVEVVSPDDVLQPGMFETWLITELCDRGSMADIIDQHKLPAREAGQQQRDVWVLLCLLDIALGLTYLHSSGIVHGDLKPGNVLLKGARNNRRGFVCKLGDFGLSRMLGQEQTHVDTKSYGTPSYASPELLTGKLTKAADIYAFAMIVWELLTGEELYPNLSTMQIIVQVSQSGMRPELPTNGPPKLIDLMQRCWSQDPAHRPAISSVVDELRAMLSPLMRRDSDKSRPGPSTT